MRLQAEDIGFVAVVRPIALGHRRQHLIHLLVVLVRPHIGRESGGKGIESDAFQLIAEEGIAMNAHQFFQRKHEFGDGA